MNYSEKILDYYKHLKVPTNLPDDVEVLYPFDDPKVWNVMDRFYRKYFNQGYKRIFLIGINPGRLGSGTTGIPFTDPIRLREELSIENDFDPKQELSSRFIYTMINSIGGPEKFYRNFYFTSVSPLGFINMDGTNLNYYDSAPLEKALESFIVEEMRKQIAFGAHKIAFSIGKGKNIAYLRKLNKKHQLFDDILPLPHPRWVMQYRLKRLNEFVSEYVDKLNLEAEAMHE